MTKVTKALFVFMCCLSFVVISNADEGEKSASEEKSSLKTSDSSSWGIYYSARAVIKGFDADSLINGRVDFVETGGGLQMVASVSGVTPGNHGIHIHEGDSCEDGGKTAGGHFDPVGTPHGLLVRDGHGKAHTGDIGNIEVKDDGTGSLILFLPGLSLTKGHTNITGRAVILKEKEDDFSQPDGNAGAGIGCGTISLNN
jgi:superoxide dismutase, Cu-Zn family